MEKGQEESPQNARVCFALMSGTEGKASHMLNKHSAIDTG